MLRIALCYFAFLAGSLFSDQVDFNFEGSLPLEEEKLFVSLGSGCDTGITLRDCHLRHAAFPFDWLISGNHERFITLLDEDFKFFTEEGFLLPLSDPRWSDHPNCILNNYYDILFVHEGTVLYEWTDQAKYLEQISRLKAKYSKRINRFRQIRQFPGKVFFIRNFTSTTQDQADRHPEMAKELRDALQRYFPSTNFTLVIVTYKDVNAPKIGALKGVLEFRMERAPWRQEYEKMYEILIRQ